MHNETTTSQGAAIDILLVEAADCHYCEDTRRLVDELTHRFPLRIEAIAMESEEGRDLVATHRIPFPPLLLVNGEYFGYGRISGRKLERHLTALAGSA